VTETKRFCENCGAEISARANFCASCGATQEADLGSQADTPGAPPSTESASHAPAAERRGGAPLGAAAKWSLTIILVAVTVIVVLALIAIVIAAVLGILRAG
jgi:hypothetical protein